MLRVTLDVTDVKTVRFEMPERLLAEAVIADAAGDDGAVAEQCGDVREICGRAAELFAFCKEIPEKFAQSDHQGPRIVLRRRHRSGGITAESFHGIAAARRASVRVRRLRRGRDRDTPVPADGAKYCC